MVMEVKMRYLSQDIAKHFGSSEKTETIRVSDSAMYEHLLGLLKEKYEAASKRLYGEKLKAKMLDTFVILSGGRPLQTLRDKLIKPDTEVLVAYVGLGG